jgi:hypothetical protein
MRHPTLIIILLIFAGLPRPAAGLEIPLPEERYRLFQYAFYVPEILDSGRQPDTLGYVRAGFFNRPAPVTITGGLREGLKNYLDYLLPRTTEKTPVRLGVPRLQVGESKSIRGGEWARAAITMVFSWSRAGKPDTSFTVERSVEHWDWMDATRWHQENIRQLLVECIHAFARSGWDKPPEPTPLPGVTTAPLAGDTTQTPADSVENPAALPDSTPRDSAKP